MSPHPERIHISLPSTLPHLDTELPSPVTASPHSEIVGVGSVCNSLSSQRHTNNLSVRSAVATCGCSSGSAVASLVTCSDHAEPPLLPLTFPVAHEMSTLVTPVLASLPLDPEHIHLSLRSPPTLPHLVTELPNLVAASPHSEAVGVGSVCNFLSSQRHTNDLPVRSSVVSFGSAIASPVDCTHSDLPPGASSLLLPCALPGPLPRTPS